MSFFMCAGADLFRVAGLSARIQRGAGGGAMIIAICVAVISLIAGGYGLGLVCYERGYVHGYDDAENGGDIVLTLEDDG